MRKILIAGSAVVALSAMNYAASAQQPRAEVLERDARGKATRVKVGDSTYDVCREGKHDNCINPREAGLNFGNVPIDHWPGQTGTSKRADNNQRR